MKTEFSADILSVRAVEDCIRATRKYTKGVFRKPAKHPIQGEEFPSKVLTEYYEVYPDLDVIWDMKWSDFWAWVWGDVLHVDVFFHYNYVTDRARVVIHGGDDVVRSMERGIPGLRESLEALAAGEGAENGIRVGVRSVSPLRREAKEGKLNA